MHTLEGHTIIVCPVQTNILCGSKLEIQALRETWTLHRKKWDAYIMTVTSLKMFSNYSCQVGIPSEIFCQQLQTWGRKERVEREQLDGIRSGYGRNPLCSNQNMPLVCLGTQLDPIPQPPLQLGIPWGWAWAAEMGMGVVSGRARKPFHRKVHSPSLPPSSALLLSPAGWHPGWLWKLVF